MEEVRLGNQANNNSRKFPGFIDTLSDAATGRLEITSCFRVVGHSPDIMKQVRPGTKQTLVCLVPGRTCSLTALLIAIASLRGFLPWSC